MLTRRVFLAGVIAVPFSNYTMTKNGALTIPSVHSPNFNVANPLASPSPSWGILKNGLAYFFGLTLSGGTFTGPDYIIDSTGAYFYTGTPAAGNLIISIGSGGGVDPIGNKTVGGLAGYDNAGGCAIGYSGLSILAYTGSLSAGWTPTGQELGFSSVGGLLLGVGSTVEVDSIVSGSGSGAVTFPFGLTVSADGAGVTGGTKTDTLDVTSTSTLTGTVTGPDSGTWSSTGVSAKKVTATTSGVTTNTLDVTSTSTLTGTVTGPDSGTWSTTGVSAKKLTATTSGASVTGGTTTDTLDVTSTSTLTGAVTATGGTAAAPTVITTDTFHDLSGTYANSWATNGAALSIELLPNNNAYVSGILENTAGGISGSSNITTAVAAAYRPSRDVLIPCASYLSASPFGNTAGGFVLMRTTGVIEFFGTFATTDTLRIAGTYLLAG